MTEIKSFFELSEKDRKKALVSLEEVFFEAALKKNFSSLEEKKGFFKRWVGYYISHCREEIFLAYDSDAESSEIEKKSNRSMERVNFLGYLTGCSDSLRALPEISANLKSYVVFEDLFVEFPAHLHINLAEKARGKGAGSLLIQSYCRFLKEKGVRGVHLVTSPEALNVSFYLKNGFTFRDERDFKGTPLLFMGRKL